MKRNNRNKARSRQARPAQSVLKREQRTETSSWRDVFSRGQWYGVIVLAIVIGATITMGQNIDQAIQAFFGR